MIKIFLRDVFCFNVNILNKGIFNMKYELFWVKVVREIYGRWVNRVLINL